jgi:hypothetical protein
VAAVEESSLVSRWLPTPPVRTLHEQEVNVQAYIVGRGACAPLPTTGMRSFLEEALDPGEDLGNVDTLRVADAAAVDVRDVRVDA